MRAARKLETPPIPREVLLRLYREMVRLRTLDERMMTLQRQGRVGFYGACTGQEAATLASAIALEASDWIFPALREGGAMLLRGFPLVPYLCQIFGNAGDETKGRQMPSHMASRSVNQVSWSSCIGTQLPQAVGAAMAARIKGDRTVIAAYLGDGATSEGDFHVAMNFAGVFKAPVVFICQNNHWAISVPTSKQTASESIAIKAQAYGFPGVKVDGNDALAVYAAVKEAVDRARSGGGPTLVECEASPLGGASASGARSLWGRPPRRRSENAARPPARPGRVRGRASGAEAPGRGARAGPHPRHAAAPRASPGHHAGPRREGRQHPLAARGASEAGI